MSIQHREITNRIIIIELRLFQKIFIEVLLEFLV